MNWKKIDLTDSSNHDLNLVDSMTIEDLLIACNGNLETIDESTVEAQFEEMFERIISDAQFVFESNKTRLVEAAIKYRG